MDQKTKIINMRSQNYFLDDQYLVELSKDPDLKFRYTTVVAYNKKTRGVMDLTDPPSKVSYNNEAPFSLYGFGTSIAVLKKYIGNGSVEKKKLSSAIKAFKELKNFSLQCCERINADLCCKIIMDEIKGTKAAETLIFFIEKSASDKMLGRLSALQLNLSHIIICFLTYNPSNLMTIAMSNQPSKLHFDIHRLMRSDNADFLGPYPGDSEDSLIQAYFHKPPAEGDGYDYYPMRFDVFCQGLRLEEMLNKIDIIKEIFLSGSNDIETDEKVKTPRRRMPVGFGELGNYLKKLKEPIRDKLIGYGA